MADNPHPSDNPPIVADEIFTFNGVSQAADPNNRRPVLQAVGIAISEGDSVASWAGDDNPLPTREGGIFGYASGSVAATVDVPAQALLRRISVIADDINPATVTIGGGSTISIPSGGNFDEQIPGRALGADVIIGGSVISYYVSWTT